MKEIVEIHDIENPKREFRFKIELDSESWVHRYIKEIVDAGKLYEAESGFIADRLVPGDHFVDVGAHIGWYTLLAAALGASVESFEPEASNYQSLLKNINLNPHFAERVIPHFAAMSARSGITQLHVNSDNDGGHGLWDVGNVDVNEKTRAENKLQWVRTTTIEKYLPACNIPGRVWIKIDTEGYEMQILQRFPFWYENNTVFIVEINRTCLQLCGTSEAALRSLFYKHGYKSYALMDTKISRIWERSEVGITGGSVFNMIFTREDL